MNRTLRHSVLMLCLLALALRMSGLHVHVGLDHHDHHAPHAAVLDIVQDDSDHDHADDHHGASGMHHLEVNLDHQALSKKSVTDLGVDFLLFIVVLCCGLFAAQKIILPLLRQCPLPQAQRGYWRPPLRGPPFFHILHP